MNYKQALMAVALVAGTLASVSHAQEGMTFGYPVTQACNDGCGVQGRQGHFQNLKSKLDHMSMLNERVRLRNDAWPKPWACIDRRNYHLMWAPMLGAGREQRCLVPAIGFDKQTNELNTLGINQVADIMRSLPSSQRTVFIEQDVDDAVNQERMTQVKNTIDRYYAQFGVARIALSTRKPHIRSATESELIQEGRVENRPAPVIQSSTGGSVAQEVGN